jgi:hypothetical protein
MRYCRSAVVVSLALEVEAQAAPVAPVLLGPRSKAL